MVNYNPLVKRLVQWSIISGVSIGSFIIGVEYGKRKCKALNFQSYSIFDSVLAATPFSPVPIQESNTPNRISQIMKHGFPSLDNIRSFDDYVLSYDRRNRVATWVFEHLTAENTKHNKEVDRSKCDFKPDESIHPYFR